MSSELPCISMNFTSFERYSSGIQSPVSTCPPAWTYSRNSCVRVSTEWPPYRTVVSIEYMSTRRADLTREAARLFAERGFHGTSMGDLAQALGVQKGSLYSLTGSKQELLFETMREGARAFHAALDEVPEDAPAIERVRLALRGHLRVVSRAARRRHGVHARVALPRGEHIASRSWRSAAGTRTAGARSSAKASSPAACGPTSTSAPRRCSSSRRRTGHTPG